MGAFENLKYGSGTTARLYVSGMNGRAASDERPGVLVLHPWWGLNQDVMDFADRLGLEGYAVAAPDMFNGKVETTVEGAEKTSDEADQAVVGSIVLAAADWLAGRVGSSGIAALGFSYGGAWAVWAPTRRPNISATVVYYGTWTGPVLEAAKVPVLGHFAEDDPYESAESVAAFEEGLEKAGRDAEIHRYPGTGHWFAEPSRKDAYDPKAAELAFGRTARFLKERLGS